MTDIDKKREQIREGLAIHLYNRFELVKEGVKWLDATEQARQYFRQVTRSLLAQLHLQGVAIKIDRELPVIALEEGCEETCHRIERDRLVNSGLEAVEPLIKEK